VAVHRGLSAQLGQVLQPPAAGLLGAHPPQLAIAEGLVGHRGGSADDDLAEVGDPAPRRVVVPGPRGHQQLQQRGGGGDDVQVEVPGLSELVQVAAGLGGLQAGVEPDHRSRRVDLAGQVGDDDGVLAPGQGHVPVVCLQVLLDAHQQRAVVLPGSAQREQPGQVQPGTLSAHVKPLAALVITHQA